MKKLRVASINSVIYSLTRDSNELSHVGHCFAILKSLNTFDSPVQESYLLKILKCSNSLETAFFLSLSLCFFFFRDKKMRN